MEGISQKTKLLKRKSMVSYNFISNFQQNELVQVLGLINENIRLRVIHSPHTYYANLLTLLTMPTYFIYYANFLSAYKKYIDANSHL